jgi:hypothetical protein
MCELCYKQDDEQIYTTVITTIKFPCEHLQMRGAPKGLPSNTCCNGEGNDAKDQTRVRLDEIIADARTIT